jgi:oligopeptide transport system permease protein
VGRYFIRRVLQFIPVFIGATLLIFSLVFALPGDPIRALAGDRPQPQSVQDQLRDEYNLDDPLLVQYGKYIGFIRQDDSGEFDGLLQGNFGTDFRGRPVNEIMADKLPVSIKLALFAFVFETILGLLAGVLAGLRKGSFIDNLVLVSTVAVISIPIFVLGFIAQLTIGVELGWLPIAGIRNGWVSYVLPGIVLGSVSLAYIARLTRTSLVENLRTDYVRTATSKGLARGRVVGIHTMRNSMIPVVTYLGIDLGNLMSGAIVTETIFNLPGIGREVFLAVQRQEGTVVVGIVTFLVLIYMVSNLLVDFLYAALDPRIRYE